VGRGRAEDGGRAVAAGSCGGPLPIAGDGADLSYVTVRVLDAHRVLAPRAAPLLRFAVSGPIEIAGRLQRHATDLTGLQAPVQRAYNACARWCCGAAGRRGTGVLTVRVDGNPFARGHRAHPRAVGVRSVGEQKGKGADV
jgi:beta-galactosidase